MTSDFLKRPEVTAKVTAVDKARVVDEFTRDEPGSWIVKARRPPPGACLCSDCGLLTGGAGFVPDRIRHCSTPDTSSSNTRKSITAGVDIDWWCG